MRVQPDNLRDLSFNPGGGLRPRITLLAATRVSNRPWPHGVGCWRIPITADSLFDQSRLTNPPSHRLEGKARLSDNASIAVMGLLGAFGFTSSVIYWIFAAMRYVTASTLHNTRHIACVI